MQDELTHLWSLVRPSLQQHGGEPAWICRRAGRPSFEMSYAEVESGVYATTAELRRMGIGRGDIVGIMAPNGPEWAIGALAGWRLGAVVAPLHIGFSAHDLGRQIEALQPRCIVAHDTARAPAAAVSVKLTAEPEVIDTERAAPVVAGRDHEALRIYTSGSTGQPKMVRLSHHNIASNVVAASKLADIGTRDRFLSLLPLSHAFGLTGVLLLPMYCGSTIVTPKVLAASEILAAVQEEGISIIVAVPRLFRNIMHGLEKRFAEGGPAMQVYLRVLRALPLPVRRLANFPLRRRLGGHIKCWISGGSRLDPDITRYFHALGLPLRQGYGLTETAPVVSVQEEFDPVLDGVGRPIEGVEVRVHEPDEQGCGELWVKGPNVMLGYVDAEQTRLAFSDGWYRTGDIARIDASGKIVLTGRIKRVIVTEAGKNVYPEELETLLERDAAIKEAAILEQDMRPVAILAMQDNLGDADAHRSLKAFNALVSSHNRISRFARVEELPRTPLGKIALKELPRLFTENEVRS